MTNDDRIIDNCHELAVWVESQNWEAHEAVAALSIVLGSMVGQLCSADPDGREVVLERAKEMMLMWCELRSGETRQ